MRCRVAQTECLQRRHIDKLAERKKKTCPRFSMHSPNFITVGESKQIGQRATAELLH